MYFFFKRTCNVFYIHVMCIKLNYINVFKKCIEKLQYMYIVRHRTTWDHWDLGPCAPILQYGQWAQPLHPKIEPKTY